jgi:hypothetical protein
MADIQKSNIQFLLRFLDEAINCGEISGDKKKHIMENNDLIDFFQEDHNVCDECDECVKLVETLEDTLKELSTLKKKIRSDGLDYLLDEDEKTFDGRTTFPEDDNPETNQFIIRYIQLTIDDFETVEEKCSDKVVYKIFKRGYDKNQGFTLNGDEAFVNGTSCGVITGPDSTFPIYDLKGLCLYDLDNIIDEYYR